MQKVDPRFAKPIKAIIEENPSFGYSLYRPGELTALVPVEREGEVRNVVFSRRVPDRILGKVRALAVLKPDVAGAFVSVTEACRRFGGNSANMLIASPNDEIPAFRASGKVSLHAVRVHRAELQKRPGQVAT